MFEAVQTLLARLFERRPLPPYEQGRKDWRHGRDTNPHQPGSRAAREWERGADDALHESFW